MNLNFNGGGTHWTGTAEVAEKDEKDKHQPWRATLRPENGEQVEGHFLVTDLAAEAADKDGNSDSRLGTAFSRAIIAGARDAPAEVGLPVRRGPSLGGGLRVVPDCSPGGLPAEDPTRTLGGALESRRG